MRRHILKEGEKEGLSIRVMAKRFGIASRSIVNWKKKLEPVSKHKRKARRIEEEKLREDVKLYRDAYHYERAKRLGVSASGIGHALRRLGITLKKNTLSSQGPRRRTASFLPEDSGLSSSWQDDCLSWWVRFFSGYAKNPWLCVERATMLWKTWLGS